MSKISEAVYRQYYCYVKARRSPHEGMKPQPEEDWTPSEVKHFVDDIIRVVEGLLSDEIFKKGGKDE